MTGAGLAGARPAAAATTSQLASQIVTSVNSIRTAHHVAKLTVDSRLTLRADQHAALIVKTKQLKEAFPGEASLNSRLVSAGYDAAAAAVTVGWRATASSMLALPAVFASAAHAALRSRLISSGYTNIGVAVRISTAPTRYIVSIIYARPLPAGKAYANHVLTTLNQERAANHLPALRWNTALISSAHAHNLAMAKANSMSHQVSGEAFFATRIDRAGYHYRAAAENIGYTSVMSMAGAVAMQTKMYNEKAPDNGHRLNILSRTYQDVGVDVVVDTAHHRIWLTEDFGSR